MKKIAITSIASISPLGNNPQQIWQNYCNPKTLISKEQIGNQLVPVAKISDHLKQEITTLKNSDLKYKSLDNSVLYAIYASRQAIKNANWNFGDDFGINIGSSRGATELFEKYHQEFLTTGKTATLTSPTTTLGNIATWVAHDLKSQGPEISHSITCSTALHALLNGIAWMKAGMATKFLVGGSEAPLTPFTIAQMQALKIYSKEDSQFPCRAFDLQKTKNSMVLGEGASVACLELGKNKNALCYVEGIGYATDELQHNISISDEAECFQKSMKMALQNTNLEEVDVIVMHAPGTLKGDTSEYKAIKKVFGTSTSSVLDSLPILTTNKWKIGHTFGASGMLNIEMAILMMQHQQFIEVPFAEKQKLRKNIRKVLINAVGFGGNAVSVLLSKE
ncbi:beta-ketoacyl synthase N-terminal-like domain-containing protein [Flavobacterium sp.]|uniref:beta-ketoacyl synthase N-terminal-like domain-containing protein n=1 Tax=Flavobacterium sp. TaxID=239 RepID=UPI003750FAEE